jgi:hypothetical protein
MHFIAVLLLPIALTLARLSDEIGAWRLQKSSGILARVGLSKPMLR